MDVRSTAALTRISALLGRRDGLYALSGSRETSPRTAPSFRSERYGVACRTGSRVETPGQDATFAQLAGGSLEPTAQRARATRRRRYESRRRVPGRLPRTVRRRTCGARRCVGARRGRRRTCSVDSGKAGDSLTWPSCAAAARHPPPGGPDLLHDQGAGTRSSIVATRSAFCGRALGTRHGARHGDQRGVATRRLGAGFRPLAGSPLIGRGRSRGLHRPGRARPGRGSRAAGRRTSARIEFVPAGGGGEPGAGAEQRASMTNRSFAPVAKGGKFTRAAQKKRRKRAGQAGDDVPVHAARRRPPVSVRVERAELEGAEGDAEGQDAGA